MVIMRHLVQEQVNFHSDLQEGSLLCYLVVLLKDLHLHKEVDDVVEVHSYYADAVDDVQVVVDHVAGDNREVEDKDFFDLHQDEKKRKESHCTEEDGEHDHHLHESHLRCLEGELLLLH